MNEFRLAQSVDRISAFKFRVRPRLLKAVPGVKKVGNGRSKSVEGGGGGVQTAISKRWLIPNIGEWANSRDIIKAVPRISF